MNAINVQYLRYDEINDIFSYIGEKNEVKYISFPRTMEMNVIDVENYLNG